MRSADLHAACCLLSVQDLTSLTPLLSEWVDPATGAMDESFAQALLNFDPAANYFSFEWNRQPTSVQEAREIQQNMARGQTDSGGWDAHAAAAQSQSLSRGSHGDLFYSFVDCMWMVDSLCDSWLPPIVWPCATLLSLSLSLWLCFFLSLQRWMARWARFSKVGQ